MTRPKRPQTAAEIEAEIRRLEDARTHAIAAEDQRRGELLRGYLAGGHGDALRAVLARAVGPRESYLFGLERRAPEPEDRRST